MIACCVTGPRICPCSIICNSITLEPQVYSNCHPWASPDLQHPASPSPIWKIGTEYIFRGEAQNGYGFGMLPGRGLRDGYLSSLVLGGSSACKLSTSPELERFPSRRPCLMDRGVKPFISRPNIHTRSTPAPYFMIFGVLVLMQ